MKLNQPKLDDRVHRLVANGYPWARIALENLDEWAASQMVGYKPNINMADAWDVQRSDQRITALYERVFSRRSDLLQLQGQAYTRALQFDNAKVMRAHLRQVIDASDHEDVAMAVQTQMTAAATLFANSGHALGAGLESQSQAHSDANERLAALEASRHAAQVNLQTLSEGFDDDLQALLTIKNGPFDYEGRFLRQRGLYLNDFKTLADATSTHLLGLRLLDRSELLPDSPAQLPTDPDYIWQIGALLQQLSRSYYEYRARRVNRSLSFTIISVSTSPLDEWRPIDLEMKTQDGSVFSRSDWIQLMRGGKVIEFTFDVPQELLEQKLPGMKDFRLIALGVQWLADDMLVDRALDEKEVAIRTRLAAARRPIRVTGSVTPPAPTAADWQPYAVEFPNAVTTYHDLREVTAEDGFGITGLPVEGHWKAAIKSAFLHGRPVARFSQKTTPEQEYPSVYGLTLHLRVSCERA